QGPKGPQDRPSLCPRVHRRGVEHRGLRGDRDRVGAAGRDSRTTAVCLGASVDRRFAQAVRLPDRPHVIRSHIARWLTAFGAVVGALALAALPSIAQDEPSGSGSGASATAELTDVSTAAMEPGGTIKLSGHVVNTGDQRLTDVQALVRFSRNPLTDSDEIARVPVDPQLHRGLRSDIAIDEAADTLEPGAV